MLPVVSVNSVSMVDASLLPIVMLPVSALNPLKSALLVLVLLALAPLLKPALLAKLVLKASAL